MLGSSKSEREYSQDQLLLNSVSSIGVPLSLTTSTTSATNLLHSVSPLSLNNSNVLLTTTSSANFNITTPSSSTNILQQSILNSSSSLSSSSVNTDVKNQNDKNDNKEKEEKLVSHDKGSIVQEKKDENQKMDIEMTNSNSNTRIISSNLKENLSSLENENIFKLRSESSSNLNTEENENHNDSLSNSLFTLPLNLEGINDPDGTNDFLNGAIDMNIDLLNTSLTDNLNNLTVDVENTINSVSKNGTEIINITNTSSSSSLTNNTVTSSSTTTVIGSSSSGSSNSITSETTMNGNNIEIKHSTLVLNENNNSTKISNSDQMKNGPLNDLNLVTSDSTDKKELLELFNTEDLENNLKLFQFSNQSLLLPQQKDSVTNISDSVPIINEQSLRDNNTLSMITDASNASTTNANNTNTSSLSSTNTLTSSTPEKEVVSTVVSSSDSTLNLNAVTTTTTTKTISTISGTNNILTVTNPILEYPSMMNNAAYFNLNTNPTIPNTLAAPKVNYYSPAQTNPMQPNEVILKKQYNAMVKQENLNDVQKNAKNIDTVKNPINCATNSNVKINMKSVKNGAPKGRRVQSRNASLRPTLSYVELITEAICESEDGLLSLQEIYDAIKRKYVYFRTADPAWQNSIRHNLSVHQSFTKITRPPNRPGKGFLWTSSKIDYQNLSSSESRKRRKREHGEKSHIMVTTSTSKNQSYHTNYPASSNGSMAPNNVPQQNISNNMNDINYILNQQHQPRISQKVMKILTDSSINTPSLKQLLFTGFKHMSNEPYHSHNGNLNYSLNSYDGYHGPTHASSMYGGSSQYLTNSSTFPGQMTNSSIPLSLNTLVMPSVSSSLSTPNSTFTKGSSSFHNSFGNSNSAFPLSNMDNLNSQKYSGSGSSLYPISLLDPEYTFRYPSQSMFRNSYFYQKNDVLMHNTNRRYSFDSAMTSSAAFAAAAAHNNSNPNNPSPPYFSLAKNQNSKNVPSGPNYIKKDREKKIMYEKMHLTNDYKNLVNQAPPPSQYTGNASNYMTTASTSLNYSHKHLPTNYNNNLSIPSSYNTTNSIPNIPSTKPLTTPMIYDTKGDHNTLDTSVISVASTVIENETPVVVANKE